MSACVFTIRGMVLRDRGGDRYPVAEPGTSGAMTQVHPLVSACVRRSTHGYISVKLSWWDERRNLKMNAAAFC